MRLALKNYLWLIYDFFNIREKLSFFHDFSVWLTTGSFDYQSVLKPYCKRIYKIKICHWCRRAQAISDKIKEMTRGGHPTEFFMIGEGGIYHPYLEMYFDWKGEVLDKLLKIDFLGKICYLWNTIQRNNIR